MQLWVLAFHFSSVALVILFLSASVTHWAISGESRELRVPGCSSQEWILYLPAKELRSKNHSCPTTKVFLAKFSLVSFIRWFFICQLNFAHFYVFLTGYMWRRWNVFTTQLRIRFSVKWYCALSSILINVKSFFFRSYYIWK